MRHSIRLVSAGMCVLEELPAERKGGKEVWKGSGTRLISTLRIQLRPYAVALFRGFSVTREAQQVLFLETRRLRILGQTRTPFGCWLATVPQERSPRDV